jgi:hypothetical protein
MFISSVVALNSLKKWKTIYLITLLAPFMLLLGYLFTSVSSEPKVRNVLLNSIGAVYRHEDLSKSMMSEGEVKQLLHDNLLTMFTYDYLSFLSPPEYEKLVSGEGNQDLPDHRDAVRPIMSPSAHRHFVDTLMNEEWMRQSGREHRIVRMTITSPPTSVSTTQDFALSSNGRLEVAYNGFFYITSRSNTGKTYRYRLDYDVTMERKTVVPDYVMPKYFFSPLVVEDNPEWRIKSFTWKSSRKR